MSHVEVKFYIKVNNNGTQPIGTIYQAIVLPETQVNDWLPLDGQVLDKDIYPELWNLLSDSNWGYYTITHSLSIWYNPFSWGKVRHERLKLDEIKLPLLFSQYLVSREAEFG